VTPSPARVALLVQENCVLCEQAKQVLTRVASDFPIVVEEIDLGSHEGRRLAQRGGVMFAPGVFVDDQMFGFGRLSEKKLRRLLQRRSRLADTGHP
jgi:glutaredoxin